MSKWSKCFTRIGLLCLLAALGLTAYNIWSDAQAGKITDSVLQQMKQAQDYAANSPVVAAPSEEEIPDYILNPEMDMPVQEIDGQDYIGTLEIESLGLSLPVISEWSYPRLRIAPCRYTGSAYLNNMVIAAHNYTSHFGQLKNLSQGDLITFTDVDGNVFYYQVSEIEILSPYSIQEMSSGEWDLTLFTCTIGGQTRVTVRCEQMETANLPDTEVSYAE